MNSKILIRNSVARLLSLSGLINPQRRGRGRLSIATFHRVLPDAERKSYPFQGLAVTPDELDNILSFLKQHFDCDTLARQHQRYVHGECTAKPLLAVTFDDAQHDNYQYAKPVLDRHQMKASFFVPVDAVERGELLWHDRLGFAIHALLAEGGAGHERLTGILLSSGMPVNVSPNLAARVTQAAKSLALEDRLNLVDQLVTAAGPIAPPDYARLMNFDELAKLSAEGHEIGSHSMTHCMMPECNDKALTYEVAESRRILQNKLGQSIESFCYPNGNADARTAQALKQAGYSRGITTAWGNNGLETDRYRMHRYDMVAKHVQDAQGKFVPAMLAFRMSGWYPGLGK